MLHTYGMHMEHGGDARGGKRKNRGRYVHVVCIRICVCPTCICCAWYICSLCGALYLDLLFLFQAFFCLFQQWVFLSPLIILFVLQVMSTSWPSSTDINHRIHLVVSTSLIMSALVGPYYLAFLWLVIHRDFSLAFQMAIAYILIMGLKLVMEYLMTPSAPAAAAAPTPATCYFCSEIVPNQEWLLALFYSSCTGRTISCPCWWCDGCWS